MAKYDNIQLYSNYQSYYKRNKINDNSLVSDTKSTRKKINHNCDNEIITSLSHKRPKTSYCSFTTTTKNNRNNNNYNDEMINNSDNRNNMHKSATTALFSDNTKSSFEADSQLLIVDRNNINNKNMCCTETTISSLTDSEIDETNFV